MADPLDDTVARNRWLALNAARLAGIALTVFAIMVLSGETELPRAVGWIALALGLPASLILPQLLVRRWRSPRP